ncbi:Endonuclease [Citrus sinensis]|nr:Endonuclease [Citrus sinensis]
MGGRSQMQLLLSKLSEHKYIEWHRSFDNTNIVKDLFWAHPVSIDLLHAFPCVLLMDCTYKCNSYNLPLLQIVGVTSTEMTFPGAFAYLESEREDNYTWALTRLKSVLDDSAMPKVILSDRDLALINAIKRVFPNAKHLLCSEDEFITRLNALQQDFISYPQAIEYVTSTWLDKYKENFVSAWTDKIMHFGNLTTNRVESSHSRLKKELGTSQGNFETSWTKIHSLLELLHTNIKASFEKSLTVVQHQFKPAEFKKLRGFISISALQMVLSESKNTNSIGIDVSVCGCTIRSTHGLPCAHEIVEYKRESRPIPLECIDSHWKKLDLIRNHNKRKVEMSYGPIFDLIAKRFNENDDDMKLHILQKLAEIANPHTTSLIEPEAKKNTRGRPNSKANASTCRDPSAFEIVLSGKEICSPTVAFMRPAVKVNGNKQPKQKVYKKNSLKSNPFVNEFPAALQSYIHHIKDVAPDGNCGFRAIADLMGFGENGWLQVRKDLLNELHLNMEHYSHLYGTYERVNELIHAISYFENCPGSDKWMTMPDMGHLIASAYNIVVFHLSMKQCLTFLPLRSNPVPTDSRKEIAIGFVNNNHFVEVKLTASLA